MTFRVKLPVGLGDRLLAEGESVLAEELGEGLQRLLELGILEPDPQDEPEGKPKARKSV